MFDKSDSGEMKIRKQILKKKKYIKDTLIQI